MSLRIRTLGIADIEAADAVNRVAFGTYFGLPDPTAFRGDAALVRPRRQSYPDGALVAELDGRIVGLAIESRWGSLGVLGPVSVHPEVQKQGIARALIGAALETTAGWGVGVDALFTFPNSASHIRFYQSLGFWPRSLNPVMAKPVSAPASVPGVVAFSAEPARQATLLAGCRALTGAVFAGLDLNREIEIVAELGMGDTLLLMDGTEVAGFAICHTGAGSEGGSKGCYIKFAIVRSGRRAAELFTRLLAACNDFAHGRGVGQISAGVSTARHDAYRLMVEMGFHTTLMGVAMHRPHVEAYDRPEVFAIDDWR